VESGDERISGPAGPLNGFERDDELKSIGPRTVDAREKGEAVRGFGLLGQSRNFVYRLRPGPFSIPWEPSRNETRLGPGSTERARDERRSSGMLQDEPAGTIDEGESR